MDNFAKRSVPAGGAIATLPHLVNSNHINSIAETILRSPSLRDSTSRRTNAGKHQGPDEKQPSRKKNGLPERRPFDH
jgi:hypothetical protein